MPHEIDGSKAVYGEGRRAWHGIGTVMDGLLTAEECLQVLDPAQIPIQRAEVSLTFTINDENGKPKKVTIPAPDFSGVVDWDHDSSEYRALSIMARDYPIVQIRDQFRFMDDVIGQIDGAHYANGIRLRKGKQTVITAFLGDYVLDPKGIADHNQRYLAGFNSYNGSWALRLKWLGFRPDCANMAAMALRGSTDANVIGSDWSTKHTSNIMNRVNEAKSVLGFMQRHQVVSQAMEEHMIHVPLATDTFVRVIRGLFTDLNPKTNQVETDEEAVNTCIYQRELSPSSKDIADTMWGGFNVVTEYNDWVVGQKARGSRTMSVNEQGFIRAVEDPKGLKQRAWDSFWDEAAEAKPFKMPDLVDA